MILKKGTKILMSNNKNGLNVRKDTLIKPSRLTTFMNIEVPVRLEGGRIYCCDIGAFTYTNYNFDTYNSLTPNWYYKVLR